MEKSSPVLFISTVSDGHMGVSAPENRKKYFSKIGIDSKKIVDIVVTHGNKIKIASKKDGGKYFEGFDGVVTNEKDLVIGLTVADCMPIAVFDPIKNSIGLIHAGWRGLESGIIGKTIESMSREFKVQNSKLIVFIGAHICQKHYEVHVDVSGKFKSFKGASFKDSRTFLDLGLIAKQQLIKAGIKEKNITMDNRCTFEDKELFSYRRGDIKNRNLYLFGNF